MSRESFREAACHFPLERWPLTPDEMRAPAGIPPKVAAGEELAPPELGILQ